MAELNRHWTERDVESFLFHVSADFVRHMETLLDKKKISRAKLAEKLGVSQGRISQVMNDPGNLTLKQIIKYSRAIGEKVALISYDDNDPANQNGPIAPEVFTACWVNAGKPSDFFDMKASTDFFDLRVERGDNVGIELKEWNWNEIEGSAYTAEVTLNG